MKNLDKLIVPPCSIQTADQQADCTKVPGVPGEDGEDVVDPPIVCTDLDVCCSDPAYAAEHPEQCANRTRLIIKPEFVSKPVLQAVQYSTFLVNSLGQETELTAGLEYSVSDPLIAVIGSASGNLTTLAEGVATVRVKWQNLSAQAQLNVVAECSDATVGMMLVIDNSKSMNQKFSDSYASRLAYAKTLARRFASELNTTKDKMGLVSFADVAALVRELTNDTNTLRADIQTLPSSQSRTDIREGLRVAIDHLNSQTLDRKVVVLFTDGAKNDGEDPLPLAQSFKDGGGIIVVVGIRSHGVGFSLLQKLATTGFLLNSYDATNESANSDFLSGMKGYFCAGNCVPEGDVYQSKGALSYKGFKEWDVDGDVDLIGKGSPNGQQLFDLLPGNGLYVDVAGSGPPWLGTLVSKRTFKLEAAVTYRLQFKLAGNQRLNVGPHTVRVTVGSVFIVDVTIADWQQPFTSYSYDMVGDGTEGNKVRFQLIEAPAGGAEAFGPLLDQIRFDRITAPSALLLFDDFDSENETYIAPGCGGSGGGGGGELSSGQQLINIHTTGPTWIPRAFRTGSWFSSAMKSDGSVMYVGEFSGKIVKSADSGVTWANTTAPDRFWRALACANDGVKVLGAGTPASFSGSTNVQVHVSTDSGANWTAKTVESGYGWAGAACDSTGAKMAVVAMPNASGTGYLYTSTDTGDNWTRRDDAGNKGFTGVAMSADGQVIVATSLAQVGLIVFSLNGGATWSQVLCGTKFLRDVRITGDGATWVVCNDETVFSSPNQGTNWNNIIFYQYGDPTLKDMTHPWVRLSVSDDGLKIVAVAVDQITTTGRKDSLLAVTVDGGFSWRRSFLGHSYWMCCIARDGSKAIAGASFEQMVLAGSAALDVDNVKRGAAVVFSFNAGQDYWNEWSGETPLQSSIVPDPLYFCDGTTVIGEPDMLMSQLTGGYDWAAEVTGMQLDPVMRRYLKTENFTGPGDWTQCQLLSYFGVAGNGCRYVKFTGIPEGNWDFYIYGHGDANNENSRFRLTTDFDESKLAQTAEGSGMAGTWLQGVHYVVFDKIKVKKDQPVYLFILPPSGNSGGVQYNVLQGIQIKWVAPPSGGGIGGCYGTGCLDTPPPEQKPDPNPLPDIES